MKITQATTLADLSVELLSYGLRAAVILTGQASRFDVTLTDPGGVTAAGSSYDMAEAFDRALARYRELAGTRASSGGESGESFSITCRPTQIAYASGKAIAPPMDGWSDADLAAFQAYDEGDIITSVPYPRIK